MTSLLPRLKQNDTSWSRRSGRRCTEAALCLLYIGLDVWLVLIVVSLLIALTGYRKRKYKTRKSMIMGAADAPWCEFGQFKRSSTEDGFRKNVHRC
jgi:hypothetical protein